MSRFASSRLGQILILTGLTTLAVAPQTYVRGMNIVTNTYWLSVQRFWAGLSPYLPPSIEIETDWFKYSPFYALAYTPLTWLPNPVHAVIWMILNALVFWWGMTLWFPWNGKKPWWFWAALIICSMELDISVRYQQCNALLCGLTLIALAAYRDGQWAKSGGFLATASNLKILPGIFVLPLLTDLNRRFIVWLAIFSLVLLLLPALAIGPVATFEWHRQWISLLVFNVEDKGLLDLSTVLGYWGISGTKTWLPSVLLISTLSLLVLMLARKIRWDLWFTVGMAGILLANPRTESPTFVMAAPSYLFLATAFGELSGRKKKVGFLFLGICAFFITLSFTDLWPRKIWDPREAKYAMKTLSLFAIWLVSALWMAKELRRSSSA